MGKQHTDEVMNVPKLAAYIDLDDNVVRGLARQGRVPARKVGRQWRFLRSAIDAWLASAPSAEK